MKKIKLTNGGFALVDDADYEWLNQWKWRRVAGYNTYYAARSFYVNGKQKNVLMHRQILGLTDPKIYCDHKNHNGLENRRSEIRICTPVQNQMNRRRQFGSVSKYKGVCWHSASNKWQAAICINGKVTHLGVFKYENNAAQAYNKAAKKYFGEFSKLNTA